MGPHESRRSFLKTAAALALTVPPLSIPTAALSAEPKPRMKITDIRVVRHKLIKEVGSVEPAWALGTRTTFRIGGGSYLEILTDQGLVGIGPEMATELLPVVKEQLVGKDPFDTEQHFTNLGLVTKPVSYRDRVCVDIALWDLVGKACGQPLYKLWGGGKDKVRAYASMILLSNAEERARLATELMCEGWKAIKLRLHHPTMQEDLRTVEAVRKAVGDKMEIMADANQAAVRKGYVEWDFKRASDTARRLRELNCSWLEEPLRRTDFTGLAELSRSVEIPIAGGEGTRDLNEFVRMMKEDVFDIINPECLLIGVSGMRKVAALAQLFGKQVVPHNGNYRIGMIAQLHLIASCPHAPYIEILHDPPIGSYLHNFAIFRDPPTLDKDGFLPVHQKPGLGVEIDPDLIDRG